MVNDTIQEKAKDICKKYGWKAALSLLVPPLGFATFPKNIENKAMGFLAGIVVSVLSSVIPIQLFFTKTVYKSQESRVRLKFNAAPYNASHLFSAFCCPIVFSLTGENSTHVHNKEDYFSVKGHDVITFNNEAQIYELNFTPEREFYPKFSSAVSLAGAQRVLEEKVAEGDILGAKKARAHYDRVSAQYQTFTNAYHSTVAQMNSELSSLALTSKAQTNTGAKK